MFVHMAKTFSSEVRRGEIVIVTDIKMQLVELKAAGDRERQLQS